MAFSISLRMVGSQGEMRMSCGSGAETCASWLMGVWRAVVVDLDLVEHVHAGAAGARGGQVGLEVATAWSMRRLRSL